MADFRLREDAENWFKHISGDPPLKTKFDLYYFCLMIGLANRRTSQPAKGRTAQGFVDRMPEDYLKTQELIVGLMLRAEIDLRGYELDARDDIRRVLSELVGSQGLTADGVSKMNEYASGGFDVLIEEGVATPYEVSAFLLAYRDLIDRSLSAR